MKELMERWKAKMPVFWKKVMRLAFWVGGIGATVLIAAATLPVVVHEIFLQVVSYIVVACAAIAGTAKFTKDDKEVIIRDKEA